MANTIVQQITAELDTLQKELSQFKSTVGYLSDAKTQMGEAILTVGIASEDFAKRTAALKLAFDQVVSFRMTIESLVSKIDSVDFPDRLNKIENGFTKLLTIEEDLAQQLKSSVASLNAQVDKIDFNKKHEELRTDAIKNHEELQKVIVRLEGSNNHLVREINGLEIPKELNSLKLTFNKKLDDSIKELEKNTNLISYEAAKSIHVLNIPDRMDKLDANVAKIMAAMQSIQSRITVLESNIIDKLKDIQNTADQNNSSLTKTLQNSFTVLSKTMDESNKALSKTMDESNKALSKRQKTFTFITWGILALGGIAALALLIYLHII
jgi:hypothetical protein